MPTIDQLPDGSGAVPPNGEIPIWDPTKSKTVRVPITGIQGTIPPNAQLLGGSSGTFQPVTPASGLQVVNNTLIPDFGRGAGQVAQGSDLDAVAQVASAALPAAMVGQPNGAAKLDAMGTAASVPVVTKIGTDYAAVASNLGDRFSDHPNFLRDYGVNGTSVGEMIANGQDVAAAMQQAQLDIQQRGGGILVIPNIGKPLFFSTSLSPVSGVYVVGHGNPVIQLTSGANCAVVETANFQTLTGTNDQGGCYDWGLIGLTLDGNSQNQSPPNPDLCNGVSVYGYQFLFQDLLIQNVAGHGIRDEWTNAPAEPTQQESVARNVRIYNAGRHGWWRRGAPGLRISDLVVGDASQGADQTYCGLYIEPGAQCIVRGFLYRSMKPSYTAEYSYTHAKYALYSNGGNQFIGGTLSGAPQLSYLAGSGDTMVAVDHAGLEAAASGNAFLTIAGALNKIIGGAFTNAPGTAHYALALTGGAGVCDNNYIHGISLKDFDKQPFNLAGGGKRTWLVARGVTTQSGGATTLFNVDPTAHVEYVATGASPMTYITPRVNDSGYRATTTDATPTRLTLDGQAAQAGNVLTLPASSTVLTRVRATARQANSLKFATFGSVDIALTRGATAGSTTLLNGPITLTPMSGSTLTGISLVLSADTTTVKDSLAVTATGLASTTIDWTVDVDPPIVQT